MRAYTTESAYQNFIDRSQADPAHAYYGDNLDRMIVIKNRHDPDDFFRSPRACPCANLRPDLHSSRPIPKDAAQNVSRILAVHYTSRRKGAPM